MEAPTPSEKNTGLQDEQVMKLTETPFFPSFLTEESHTSLRPNTVSGTYQLLPPSWNLITCFRYYLLQKEKWSTFTLKKETIKLEGEKTVPIEDLTIEPNDESEEDKKEAATIDLIDDDDEAAKCQVNVPDTDLENQFEYTDDSYVQDEPNCDPVHNLQMEAQIEPQNSEKQDCDLLLNLQMGAQPEPQEPRKPDCYPLPNYQMEAQPEPQHPVQQDSETEFEKVEIVNHPGGKQFCVPNNFSDTSESESKEETEDNLEVKAHDEAEHKSDKETEDNAEDKAQNEEENMEEDKAKDKADDDAVEDEKDNEEDEAEPPSTVKPMFYATGMHEKRSSPQTKKIQPSPTAGMVAKRSSPETKKTQSSPIPRKKKKTTEPQPFKRDATAPVPVISISTLLSRDMPSLIDRSKQIVDDIKRVTANRET